MKGIFRKMKGRIGKKGSSLIAVMTAMAVLSIVALCAAGIAITNYRTTQTYVSQDNYYYSAEAGQAQFVSHVNDVAYNFSSSVTAWDDDKVDELYRTIANVEFDLGDTLYNGEYTVKNEIDENYTVDPTTRTATFTIITTVTASDGTTQEYTSTIKVENPISGSSTTTEIITIPVSTDDTKFFNNGYCLVANGTGKNTFWYGIWGNFNTYTTRKTTNGVSPLNSNADNVNRSGVGKCFSVESALSGTSTVASTNFGSAIYVKLATSQSYASGSGSFVNFFSADSTISNTTANKTKLENFMSNINVDIETALDAAKTAGDVNTVTGNTISLKYGAASGSYKQYGGGATMVMDATEKYYAKTNGGDFTIGFDVVPYNTSNGSATLYDYNLVTDSSGNKLFDGEQPVYRVIFNTRTIGWPWSVTTIKHAIGYQYTTASGTVKTSDGGYDYTYADHYYKNKWFFLDLNGTGTLRIENSTSTTRTGSASYTWSHFWYGNTTFQNNVCEDAWHNDNFPAFGNIVLEDCYFFVNGNIEVANAYNLSNCKIFATGDILLEKVFYLEGLLSLETNAGSDVIQQSLYYCDGVFRSELVSRYAMNWVLWTKSTNVFNPLLTSEAYSICPFSTTYTASVWSGSAYEECALKTGYSYYLSSTSMGIKSEAEGWLGTYRYPTVLKATIIAKGTSDTLVKNISAISGQSSKTTTSCSGVSVFLNPDGGTYGVVDCVLIEGQIFAAGKVFNANYNYDSADATNRYAAASQIQYQPYTNGGKSENIEDIFAEINSQIVSVEYNPVVIQNSGISKN